MDFFFLETAFEVIDLRSFSNLWFWIALAVAWSTASYWVVGVPFDMVRQVVRGDETALADLAALAGIHARRLVHIADVSGLLLTALAWFAGTALLVVGLVYRVEFAQALFLLGGPMSVVGWLNLRTAQHLLAHPPEAIPVLMIRHRRIVQAIGVVSIFVTAMWGMWKNLSASVL